MLRLRGVMAGIAAALWFAAPVDATTVGATTVGATTPGTTTTSLTTTVPATTTASTAIASTTTAITTAPTAAAATSTDATATSTTQSSVSSTTVSSVSSSTAGAAEATAATSRGLGRGCPVAAVALLLPKRTPVLLGPVAAGRVEAAGLSRLAYPADGSVATAAGVAVSERGCTSRGPLRARAQLRSLSLFAGAVTAASVDLRAGSAGGAIVAGLEVGGKRAPAARGVRVPLQGWGYLVSGPPAPVRTADAGLAVSALAIHLLEPHAGLPAERPCWSAWPGGLERRSRRDRRPRRRGERSGASVGIAGSRAGSRSG